MFNNLNKVLSADEIESIEQKVLQAAESGDTDGAWQALQPLLKSQRHQREAALSLLNNIVDGRHLHFERALEVLEELHNAYADDPEIICLIGALLDTARDIDQLNLPPPNSPLFIQIIDKLTVYLNDPSCTESEKSIQLGLSTAARMVARQRDDVAEASYKRLVELDPKDSWSHYNYGLLMKTRGRFREGMLANQAAVGLANEPSEAHQWNLGICATGAGEGAVALKVWKGIGNKIEMGRFGLPEGRYPQCKVRLAERPLAERKSDSDDPGLEETIWMERLSPCHGIIRSVLYNDLRVDYGDVVLIDGAPITYHTYGEKKVPVFPHLATLLKRNYQFYDFGGTQDAPARLGNLTERLSHDAVIYSHSENYRILCASCWRDPDLDHKHHEKEEKHVVLGRIAAPREITPVDLLTQIDKAIGESEPCKLYAPDLCEAAGFSDRAAMERRRFGMLRS